MSHPEHVGVAIGEDPDQFVLEVVLIRADLGGDPLVEHLAAAVDVLPQTVVDVFGLAAALDLLLVVELDLGYQQAGEAARLFPVRLVFGDLLLGLFGGGWTGWTGGGSSRNWDWEDSGSSSSSSGSGGSTGI